MTLFPVPENLQEQRRLLIPEDLRTILGQILYGWTEISTPERRHIVRQWLIQSKPWLAQEAQNEDPLAVSQFRYLAEDVANALNAAKASTEMINEASEVVRRAERALAQSIKVGQKAGLVSSRDLPRVLPGGQVSNFVKNRPDTSQIHIVDDYYPPRGGRGGGAIGVDGRRFAEVDDDIWERALEIAVSHPGRLSRVKVIRAIVDLKGSSELVNWVVRFEDLANRGFTSTQIAEEIGRTQEWVKRYASEHNIVLPGDRARARTRQIDPMRIIRETAIGLEGTVTALDLVDLDALDPDDPELEEHWETIRHSTGLIRRFNQKLKEIVNGND